MRGWGGGAGGGGGLSADSQGFRLSLPLSGPYSLPILCLIPLSGVVCFSRKLQLNWGEIRNRALLCFPLHPPPNYSLQENWDPPPPSRPAQRLTQLKTTFLVRATVSTVQETCDCNKE